MESMLNLVLFGPPGAGKGTQSQNLIDKYGLVHLSTGDILRSEIANGTELGRKAKEVMDRGELVSDDIVIDMIESKIDGNPHAKGFIFDGFPRTTAQAIALDDMLQRKGTGISAMLALEVDDEELTKRLLLRGKASGRPDDANEEVIRRRIQEYNNKTLPLKNYYSDQGKFHSINGIGSIDEIFKALVDRITFLKAEMELTALETDIEHLDLTIQDFDVADDIAPELLLEIDAIKRAEAEEEEEERERKAMAKGTARPAPKAKALKKNAKKAVTKKAADKKTAGKKAAAKKNSAKKKQAKPAPKKAVKKSPQKPSVKKTAKKTAKASAKKKQGPKAPKKKANAKKASVKKILKKAAGKSSSRTAPKRKPSKKTARKISGKKRRR